MVKYRKISQLERSESLALDILIMGECLDYGERLAKALVMDYGHLFNIVVTDAVKSHTADLVDKGGDILLIDSSLYHNQLPVNGFLMVVLLCEERNLVLPSIDDRQMRSIYKYQHCSAIVQQIFGYFSEVEPSYNICITMAPKHKIIGVYSPTGGSGTSTVAFALAQQYTNFGYRALYLSLESVPATHCFVERTSHGGIGLLYRRLWQGRTLVHLLPSLMQRDTRTGVYYFNDSNNLLDHGSQDIAIVKNLFAEIGNSGLCDYIILDLGSVYNHLTLDLFAVTDYSVFVLQDSAMCHHKWQSLKQTALLGEEMLMRSRIVRNRTSEKAVEWLGITVMGSIPYLQNQSAKALIQNICALNCLEILR